MARLSRPRVIVYKLPAHKNCATSYLSAATRFEAPVKHGYDDKSYSRNSRFVERQNDREYNLVDEVWLLLETETKRVSNVLRRFNR